MTDQPVPGLSALMAPPALAPEPEQIHALISDAASQARARLRNATRLECGAGEDAIRLAAAVPGIRRPETAERLGIDLADLREQLSVYTPTRSSAPQGVIRITCQ